jgi:hypothetical protein
MRPRAKPLAGLVECFAAMFVGPGATEAATAPRPTTQLGVYTGPRAPGCRVGVRTVEQASGRPRPGHLGDETWEDIASPTWWTDGWGASPWRRSMIYSVPMLPAHGASLAEGATGRYDEHFATLARTLVAAGTEAR